jgi:hypothetical protein
MHLPTTEQHLFDNYARKQLIAKDVELSLMLKKLATFKCRLEFSPQNVSQ